MLAEAEDEHDGAVRVSLARAAAAEVPKLGARRPKQAPGKIS